MSLKKPNETDRIENVGKEDSRGSSETRESRWPNEERKPQPLWLIGPKVSKSKLETMRIRVNPKGRFHLIEGSLEVP